MRNILHIRFLALILCTAMVSEITILWEGVDAISIEADTEMEHEESKEKEKEKTTTGFESLLLPDESVISLKSITTYQDPSWNSPFIDFHTPPPELT